LNELPSGFDPNAQLLGSFAVLLVHNAVALHLLSNFTMRIAQVSPLYEAVPPHGYGGTERVVFYLTEELVRLGHEVTLFASGDSATSADLQVCCPRALRLDETCRDPLAYHLRMLHSVYARADEFDVIHCHTDYLGLPLTRYVATPTILTLHGRLDVPEVKPLYLDYDNVGFVSISDAQRLPVEEMNWAETVYHGLPADLGKPFDTPSGDYLLFLGRISPEKDTESAIRVAQKAKVPLRIAAKVDAADRVYFDTRIRPLLSDPLVELVGEVDDEGKAELLANAMALVFPIDWPEPFGLVLIEALACGTPVIARPRGSVPEILEDGKTGLFCETVDDMVAAVGRVGTLDRRAYRAAFEQRFTSSRMARDYLTLYQRFQRESPPQALGRVVG
jgi:glycosyltransferase involved in cell wall biosynthesis